MYHRGYDYFTPDPGSEDEMRCYVCGSLCNVKRNIEAPRSFASAMAGIKSPHDAFTCPNSGESWHKEAIELIKEYEKTKSKRLRYLILEDINDALSKIGWRWRPRNG